MIFIPSRALDVLPADSPVVGDSAAATACALHLRGAADSVAQYRASLREAEHALARQRSEGVTAIAEKLRTRLAVGALSLERSVLAARRAFEGYAAEVDRIHAAARILIVHVENALALIRRQHAALQEIAAACGTTLQCDWQAGPPVTLPLPPADPLVSDPQGLEARYGAAWAAGAATWRQTGEAIGAHIEQWRGLRRELEQAETRLTAELSDTAIGQLVAVSERTVAARRSIVAYSISGELWGEGRAPIPMATDHPMLRLLVGSRSGASSWHSPPAAELVASRWSQLSPTIRERLIQEVPWVIGNLPGVPFAARDRANRRLLEHYVVHHDSLSPECVELLGELAAVLISGEEPPVSIVSLDVDGEIPMLAIGYGNLDTAQSLTWQVPGMESDAHRALGSWNTASRNLLRAQGAVLGVDPPAEDEVAAVAFLAYDTPNLLTVLSSASARVGARRLSAELDGTSATRAAHTPLPNLAVLAHSYGTPVAANALTQTRFAVQSLTMVGSAGLDSERVSSFDQVNVQRDRAGRPRVYTTMAAGDRLAPIGAALADRAQPNPAAVFAGRTGITGAYVFGSDGRGSLAATDGHSVLGEGIRGAFGTNASEGQGYLDPGTQSLAGVAGTTLGRLDAVPGGLSLSADETTPSTLTLG